ASRKAVCVAQVPLWTADSTGRSRTRAMRRSRGSAARARSLAAAVQQRRHQLPDRPGRADRAYSTELNVVSTRLARLTNLVDLYRSLRGGWIERTDDAPRSSRGPRLGKARRWPATCPQRRSRSDRMDFCGPVDAGFVSR